LEQISKISTKISNIKQDFDKNKLDLSEIALDEILLDFNWNAKGNTEALVARLISELQALEAV
jgi:hypothetical protein